MSLFPPHPKQIDYLLIIGADAVLWITWLRHCGLWASPCGLRERCSLWIFQLCGLGRIYPGLSALWITHLTVHAVDFPALRARAHISAPDGELECSWGEGMIVYP